MAVHVHVRSVHDDESVGGMPPATRVSITWEAAQGASFFPSMSAVLTAWPVTSTETRLELRGAYRAPLGAVGTAVDAALGHRVAEATVAQLVADLVEQLRQDLPPAK